MFGAFDAEAGGYLLPFQRYWIKRLIMGILGKDELCCGDSMRRLGMNLSLTG